MAPSALLLAPKAQSAFETRGAGADGACLAAIFGTVRTSFLALDRSADDGATLIKSRPRVDIMDQDGFERGVAQPEPGYDQGPCTTDDDGEICYLSDSGLSLLVNIVRISQHWGRPAYYDELNDEMQREIRLWSRAVLSEDDEMVRRVRDCCKEMLERGRSTDDFD